MKCGYLNLDLEAERRGIGLHSSPSPLLDSVECQRFLHELHAGMGLHCSYGGWLEDRRHLWAGSYLEETRSYLHLGVDFNAPEGTAIYAEDDMLVVWTGDDYPEEYGWGRRVIFELHRVGVLIGYGHIEPTGYIKPGARIRNEDLIGFVDSPERNGGWHPHVHVQCYAGFTVEAAVAADGYGDPYQRGLLAKMHPDPLQFVTLFLGQR